MHAFYVHGSLLWRKKEKSRSIRACMSIPLLIGKKKKKSFLETIGYGIYTSSDSVSNLILASSIFKIL